MKVLLTGYTGYLGRYIGTLLNEQGFKIRILLNRTTIPWSEREKNCEYIFGSFDDPKVIREAIEGEEYERAAKIRDQIKNLTSEN